MSSKELVRYRVLKKTFVNGSLIDPRGRKKDVFVMAAPGLQGTALELAPEGGKAKAADDGGGKEEKVGADDSGPEKKAGGKGGGNKA